MGKPVKLMFQFPDRNSVDLDSSVSHCLRMRLLRFQFPDRNSVDLDLALRLHLGPVSARFNSLIGILWI